LSPLTALIPAAASAATSLAKSAAHGIAEGVSFAAELARGNRDAGATASAIATPPSLPAELQDAINRFAELIRQRLASAGIELAQPLSLTGDGLGGINVAEDHPQAGAIESLITKDSAIADAFHQLANRFHIAMNGPDPATTSLPWDQSSAGRGVAIQIADDSARAVLIK
jgi:hypothetical protein